MSILQTVPHTRQITATLTDDQYDILEAFAAEKGIESIEEAIPAMIGELLRLHDAIWDAQFPDSAAHREFIRQEMAADRTA